jgi:hypothetical protein
MREERRLRVLEKNVLRTIFGPKRDEAQGVGVEKSRSSGA